MSNENSKRYYWVKLDYKRFESGGDLDFLMGQKNGAEYVVLYMMLCLNTRNTGGELVSRLGEVIVPFDVDKIVRDCKYFDHDTVIVALELYKRLGLVYENDKGNLIISDFQNVVGSESYSAKRMRDMRSRNKLSQDSVGQIPTDVPSASHCDMFCDSDVTKEIRDKSKENKSIEIERDIEESNSLRSLSSSCPEPSAKTPVPDGESPVFITIPTNRTGEEFEVRQDYVDQMQELYQAVDVQAQLREMKAWSLSNPTKRKTLKGMPRFINSWLSRAQDRGSVSGPARVPEQANPFTRDHTAQYDDDKDRWEHF